MLSMPLKIHLNTAHRCSSLLILVALCGGASFSPDDPIRAQNGMIWASSGVCCPFSDIAEGTVPADGAAVVVLVSPAAVAKMSTAATGADHQGENARNEPHPPFRPLRQYALVEGVGLNNDGRRKGGFCQPSLEGQMEAITLALQDAGRRPGEVSVGC